MLACNYHYMSTDQAGGRCRGCVAGPAGEREPVYWRIRQPVEGARKQVGGQGVKYCYTVGYDHHSGIV